MVADENGSNNPVGLQRITLGPVTAAGAEWEFSPSANLGNSSGTLLTGYGQLKNRYSGLCLAASGSGSSAVIEQANCDGTAPQAWTAQPSGAGSSTVLRNEAANQTIAFSGAGCVPSTTAQLDLTSSGGSCGAVDVTADSYTFFSDAAFLRPADEYDPHPIVVDPSAYSCAPGYSIVAFGAPPNQTYGFTNYSTGTVAPVPAAATDRRTIAAGTITYTDPNGQGGSGRVQLECQPDPAPSLDPAGTVWGFAKIGGVGTQLLEVNGYSTADGGIVDTWQQVGSAGSVQGNELWVYQPDASNPGYGQLVSRASGKCLEVNGTTGAVDQWDCVTAAANELWRAVPNTPGGSALQVLSSGEYLATATGNTAPASWGNGTSLTMDTAQSPQTSWALTGPEL